MTTAMIGVGSIGGTMAGHLVAGDEIVVLAAKDQSDAEAVAKKLGPRATAASVEDAIAGADAVVFALWLDALEDVLPRNSQGLEGKVVIDPSNPLGFDENGQMIRTLPDGQSSGSIVVSLLPESAHYLHPFGPLPPDSCATSPTRQPRNP